MGLDGLPPRDVGAVAEIAAVERRTGPARVPATEQLDMGEGFGVCPGVAITVVVETALAPDGGADNRGGSAPGLIFHRVAAAAEADGREAACDEQADNTHSGVCVAALTNPSGERIEPFRARSG